MNTEAGLRGIASGSAPAMVGATPVSRDSATSASANEHEIRIGKTTTSIPETSKEVEVFTMTLGAETIQLLPLRNWGQLDVYKWRVRGKLPGTPAGLEVTFDHVKVAGEVVSPTDPEGCQKLEAIFNEWLALEKASIEMAGKKAHTRPMPITPAASSQSEPKRLHFHVEIDKRQQVHIECLEGKEQVASIGLNLPGFNSLFNQGLMRKPGRLKVGALHDWVELDGTLCSFERGQNDTVKLEKLLNEQYIPATALGQGKNVVIFANAASSTGFDIQFPVTLGGVSENRRRHLTEDSLEILQDPERCGLLRPGLLVKLTRPCLVFKQKTPDGGERNLEKQSENLVTVTGDDRAVRTIDLSQPVNYMHLSAVELTAVFNHPAINRHSKLATPPDNADQPKFAAPKTQLQAETGPSLPAATNTQVRLLAPTQSISTAAISLVEMAAESKPIVFGSSPRMAAVSCSPPQKTEPSASASPGLSLRPATPDTVEMQGASDGSMETGDQAAVLPNSWLKNILAQEPIRHDWFTVLVYSRLAQKFGNSREGKFGPSACWSIALAETKDMADPSFKGIFLTEKGGLGFLNGSYMARFNKGVAFIGTQESALEGIGVNLVGVGIDMLQRIVFILSVNYRAKFGVAAQAVEQTLARLKEHSAVIMNVQEVLESSEPLELVWTVPAQQENPSDPQAIESIRPANG